MCSGEEGEKWEKERDINAIYDPIANPVSRPSVLTSTRTCSSLVYWKSLLTCYYGRQLKG